MALQGTLDTFALPDVLRLLASTSKSGCLHVNGSRGAGDVWFHAGGIVAAEAAGGQVAVEPVEVLCELLRNVDGHFSFEANAVRSDHVDVAPVDVEPLLVEAEALVAEWAEIEQVVPSLDAWVTLAEELPKAKVSIDAASWKVIIAVGGGSTVRDIGTWMEVGELAVSRGVRELVRLGLAEISEAPVASGAASPFDRPTEGAVDPVDAVDPVAPVDPVVTQDWDHTPPWADESQWVEDPGYLSFTPEKAPPPVYEEIADPEPQPVEAYTPFEPIAFDRPGTLAETLAEALPEVPDTAPAGELGTFTAPEGPSAFQEPEEDEPAPVDRSRLLKFLGSVGK